MRVAIVSDQETGGGAAVGANRLADELLGAGHEVWRVVGKPGSRGRSDRAVVLPPMPHRLGELMALPLAGRLRPRLYRHLSARGLEAALEKLRPDIINIHNLHSATDVGFSFGHAALCARQATTVWTLHDMWSFTGRCAHAKECLRYMTGCDASCPTPDEYPALEPSRIAREWRARRELLQGDLPLTAVSPSRWLAELARTGLWRGRRVEVIPHGLPLGSFRAHPRETARRALGLDPHGPVVLAGAAVLSDPFKGMSMLFDALDHVTTPLTLLIMGAGAAPVRRRGLNVRELGAVDNPIFQSLVFSAADLYVHPANQENLPFIVLEALACGTPVLATRVGGVPEAVRPDVTGWLVEPGAPAAMGRAIEHALARLAEVDLRASCRAVVERDYAGDRHAAAYVALFEELLGHRRAPQPAANDPRLTGRS